MYWTTPCPCCGRLVRVGPAIRWARTLAGEDFAPRPAVGLPIPNYATLMGLSCPHCSGAMTYPLDAPQAAA